MTSSVAAPGHSPKKAVAYDFRQPMTLAREHSRVLEMAFETFSRHWGTQLVAHLRTGAQVTFKKLDMCTYDEYVSSLPGMTTLLILGMGAGRRTGVLEFPLEKALEWIDRMLGGLGARDAVAPRDLTEIEQELIRHLTERTLHDLGYSFSTVLPLEPQLKLIQYSPQMIQATAASTPVLVARLTVEVDEHSAPATIMFPAEDIVQALRESQGADGRTPAELEAERVERERLDRVVQEVPVEVAVRMRPQPIHPREILALKVGDVLPLYHPASQAFEVVVGERVLAQAAAGTNGSRLAAVVVHDKENA
ncbi:flagellar motor switch protein FliM [Actinomycetaceae bacterium L2_0104]